VGLEPALKGAIGDEPVVVQLKADDLSGAGMKEDTGSSIHQVIIAADHNVFARAGVLPSVQTPPLHHRPQADIGRGDQLTSGTPARHPTRSGASVPQDEIAGEVRLTMSA
jgi:hypothetical protein